MALPVGRGFRVRQTAMLLAFNGGRIGSYAAIAALIALLRVVPGRTWSRSCVRPNAGVGVSWMALRLP